MSAIALAATVSGGATMAPSVSAAAQGSPGTRACATTATATMVKSTRPTARRRMGRASCRISAQDVSWAAAKMSGGSGMSIIAERGEALVERSGTAKEKAAAFDDLSRLAAQWAKSHPPAKLAVSREGGLLKVTAQGPASLRTPEPNFYILGAKSFGRNSAFLMRTGFEQVRDVFTLLMGKPVVATRYSANLDFITPETGYLVDYELVPVGEGHPPYPASARWAEPSAAHAAELLRRVYENRDEARAVGGWAAARAREVFSVDAAAARMTARLAEIRRRTAS